MFIIPVACVLTAVVGQTIQSYPAPYAPASLLTQRKTVEAFKAVQKATVEDLLTEANECLGRPNRVDRAAIAVRKLAQLRAIEASSLMVLHLTFDANGTNLTRRSPLLEADRPCAYALIRIGTPCFPVLLDRVMATDETLVHQLAAVVFTRVLGPELVTYYLTQKRDAQKDEKKAERIGQVLKYLASVERFP